MTELGGRLFPRVCIHGVSIGDLLSMSAQDLLKKEVKRKKIHQP
jgi:hypothetical protein